MFFKNHLIFLFAKFLWWGLVFGLIYILCNFVKKLSKRNVYVCNFVSFCFWLGFGMIYALLCLNLYNYSFCWFGLLGMFVGVGLVRISIEFFFTKFVRVIYNKVIRIRLRKIDNGKLQTNQKV